ncbi:MAG: thioredoxin domain-containing protein [Ignavibacteriae bacterium]|nr:thioredoxin domain-containing protein [Ignavibacteriota bacterium]NOG99694.1 thioredoxin domain-containing protein [Ignavibacteriota bacterium]
MSDENRKPNRLINEKSPYLLQHAYNPVDWYPWGEEAFEKARAEDKPIFLSIGYSTCHWCHVMEHESFEDSAVAELMNEVFVSVKVDREERPDIDNIYMTVCQMMTGGGGWPLSVVLTPDKRPFFAGTYFPKESRFGRIGFIDLIKQLDNAWKNKRTEINSSAEQITSHLSNAFDNERGSELSPSILSKTFDEFYNRFDKQYGGFSNAPKFPSPQNFLFLLRYWKKTGEKSALEMVEKTLTEMRQGGIYDHLGFGFHRYSTDEKWLVPHFEKMLYDQAMLAMAFIECYQATGKEKFKTTAEEIFKYIARDMTSPHGGFYSAEDADSEGEEGKFYVWSNSEIEEILNDDDAELFLNFFNFTEEGNFIDEVKKSKTGTNIPHLTKSIEEYADELKNYPAELTDRISAIREKLFSAREKRVHPYKDDKILTDWNGLMIAALAMSGRVLGNYTYTNSAEKSVEFIFNNLVNPDGTLLHRFREGESGLTASIDDYAFLTWGLLELYESTFKTDYLIKAISLTKIVTDKFWDEKQGGFFFTPDDGENLIVRTKEYYDSAIPSGNSVALMNLLKLSKLTGDSKYEELASELTLSISSQVEKAPSAFTQFLSGYIFAVGPSNEIIIVSGDNKSDTKEMLTELNKNFHPNKVVVLLSASDKELKNIASFTENYSAVNNKATAYVCQNYVCNLPTNDPKEMMRQLEDKNK